jgi:uncharacterized protein
MLRIILFSLTLLLLQSFVYYIFLKYIKTTKIYKPYFRFIAAFPFVIFNIPFVIISIITMGNFEPPQSFKTFFLYPFWVWQGATFFIAQWLLIGKIIKLPFKIPFWIIKLFRNSGREIENNKTLTKINLSRRKFVRNATFAVSVYAFVGSVYGVVKKDSYEITYKEIKIDNLSPELKGFTITLISDIHAGQFMVEDDMRMYADVVNSLQSDIICIPGDFVNYDIEEAKKVASAFKNLKAKYGVFGCLGNHDEFVNADYVADVLNNESPVQILRHRHKRLSVNGKDLYILGVDDTISSTNSLNQRLLYYLDEMSKFLLGKEDSYQQSPKILLCHKPYIFDDIAKKDFDLTLSGHTHGGQVVPVRFGNLNFSIASAMSKYIEGHYKIGKANMYVSRGIGTVALPIRINCPPEITKITLI